jgi:hypothetical protein
VLRLGPLGVALAAGLWLAANAGCREGERGRRRRPPPQVIDAGRSLSDELPLRLETDHYRYFVQRGALDGDSLAAFARRREAVYAGARRLLGARLSEPPRVDYYVYARASEKGAFTGDVRHAHLDPARRALHRALEPGVAGHGWDKELALPLRAALGRPRHVALEIGLGVRLSAADPAELDALAARQLRAGYGLPLAELLDDNRLAWDVDIRTALRNRGEVPDLSSPLFFEPQAGALVGWLMERWGTEEFLERYAEWSPDPLERAALEREWREQLGSAARSAGNPRRPTSGPLKGVNHTHEPLRTLEGGYLSPESDDMLERLRSHGASAVAVVPYTYFTRGDLPTALPVLRHPLKENDESAVRVIQTARRLGMSVMVKPQIQPVWPGDIAMRSEEAWRGFFGHYERWIAHYAMLAELNGAELLCVGVELVRATEGREEAWRGIVRRLRGIFSGGIVYAANWGEELERLRFWDAFDYIGVDSYYPLSEAAAPSDRELAAGARRVLARIRDVQRRHGKPVLFTELGFSSTASPWQQPWQDRRDRPNALTDQSRALGAMLAAIDGAPWVAGAFVWKWPSGPAYGGPEDRSHIVAGKPAEAVMARWMRSAPTRLSAQ